MGLCPGQCPEDHGSGLLNGFQALAQKIGVSVPKLDVVLVGLNRFAIGIWSTFSS